jgi:DNA-binding IclR family transcriptional regulator
MDSDEKLGSVEKALDILFHLHGCSRPQGVTSIGRALGIPKSSAHRLLSALGRRGLVERDGGRRYRPGVGLIALGLGVLENEPVVAVARPVLEEQARLLGETFFLVAARGGELLVLDKAEGTGFLRAAPRVGAVVPVHATAVGKLYLALDPEAVEELDAELEPFTDRTLTDAAELWRAVDEARRRGWAQNRDEWIPGLSVLAAPVLAGRRLVAALALAAATPRLDALARNQDEGLRYLRAAAERIGARLEGRET